MPQGSRITHGVATLLGVRGNLKFKIKHGTGRRSPKFKIECARVVPIIGERLKVAQIRAHVKRHESLNLNQLPYVVV